MYSRSDSVLGDKRYKQGVTTQQFHPVLKANRFVTDKYIKAIGIPEKGRL